MHERDEQCIQQLAGKPQVKRPFGRLGSGCEDDIKINLKVLVHEDVGWIRLVQDKTHWCVFVDMVDQMKDDSCVLLWCDAV
jgi:hypothetical protein